MSREQANLFFQIVAHRYEIAALGTTPGNPVTFKSPLVFCLPLPS